MEETREQLIPVDINKDLRGGPCEHKGCFSHTTHPCEGCGRICGVCAVYRIDDVECLKAQIIKMGSAVAMGDEIYRHMMWLAMEFGKTLAEKAELKAKIKEMESKDGI